MTPADPRKHPDRKPWPWWKRILYWLYNFFFGPFLTKHEDGTITGAMTRWAVAAFTIAMVYRMVTITDALGWPDAFVVFFVLYALGIDDGIKRLAKRDPAKLVDAVTGMMGQGDDDSSRRR